MIFKLEELETIRSVFKFKQKTIIDNYALYSSIQIDELNKKVQYYQTIINKIDNFIEQEYENE